MRRYGSALEASDTLAAEWNDENPYPAVHTQSVQEYMGDSMAHLGNWNYQDRNASALDIHPRRKESVLGRGFHSDDSLAVERMSAQTTDRWVDSIACRHHEIDRGNGPSRLRSGDTPGYSLASTSKGCSRDPSLLGSKRVAAFEKVGVSWEARYGCDKAARALRFSDLARH